MPVRALVEAADLFGIAEGSVRVALTRLLAEEMIERDERGLYRLGTAQPVRSRVAAWRDLGARLRVWSGEWIAVIGGANPSRRAAAQEHACAVAARLPAAGARPLGATRQLRGRHRVDAR